MLKFTTLGIMLNCQVSKYRPYNLPGFIFEALIVSELLGGGGGEGTGCNALPQSD